MKKQSNLSKEIYNSKCLYKKHSRKSLSDIINAYQNNKLDKYHFIFKMYSKYSILFEIQDLLKKREINSLQIKEDSVVFTLRKKNCLLFWTNLAGQLFLN